LDPLLDALEALWGLDGGLPRGGPGIAWIERPHGFRVAEPRPQGLSGEGGWAVYLVRRVNMDSRAAGRLLARLLGARGYRLQGLKDACSTAYQYIAVRSPERTPGRLEHGRLSAWLAGRLREPPRPGGHGFNIFSLDVSYTGDPAGLCRRLEGARWIPGFYGPQRFGVERPNTHYTGLLRVAGSLGGLVREYKLRYPLEEARPPGSYERAAIEAAASRASPTAAGAPGPARLHIEALQAYLFNKTLSRLLRSGHTPRELAEHWTTLHCPHGPVKAPAARLPSGRLASARTTWARALRRTMEAEGAPPTLWAGLPARSSLRPLAYPVCSLRCRPTPTGAIRVCTVLPAGAYATILLRSAARVDWLRYARCGSR